jgi:hypothetical protein
MSYVDNFNEYCIYREFLDDKTLLIIAYNNNTKKFYQKIMSDDDWQKINSNFDLKELELIMKVCIDKKNLYTLVINTIDAESISFNFVCMELIKTYRWQFTLLEKNISDMKYVQKLFEKSKNEINEKYQEVLKYLDENYDVPVNKLKKEITDSHQTINWLIEELFHNIEFHYTSIKKEMAMVPHMTQINNCCSKINKNMFPITFRKVASVGSIDLLNHNECNTNVPKIIEESDNSDEQADSDTDTEILADEDANNATENVG